MDRATAPGDDFFRFANGTWLKTKEIPADRSYDGVAYSLYEKTQEQTRQLIEGIDRNDAQGDDRQVKDYYDTLADEAAIEAQGLAPLQPMLANVAAIKDRRAFATYVCGELRADVDALNATNFHTDRLFGLWFAADLAEPTRYAAFMLQGGLGMPDREYYAEASADMEKIRASYLAHIETMLTLAKIPDAKAKVERVIVWHPGAVRGAAALAASESLDTWRDYLTFHVIDRNSSYLPKAFVDQRFAFYGKTLTGAQEQRARWKRALDDTNDALGDAVGKLYVRRHFPEQAKQQLQVMVKNITKAFEKRIDNLASMAPATKANAKAKVSTLVVGVGYPDKWRSDTGLGIVRGEALLNRWRAEEFNYDRERGKLDQPVARDEWMMTPQTVNAVNLPVLNAMNFPAAFLQPPFFDPAAPPAVNYGAIGAVIGHEISHSFDDQGSQFDASGKLKNWWTKEDNDHFKTASAKLVAQYNAYRPLPDLAVNGQLTLSENIADLAGLAAAYDALHAAGAAPSSSSSSSQIEKSNFTGDQQFFIAWAQTWRTKFRDQMLRQIVTTDGHAPDEYRADTVRNLDAWHDAFSVKPGQRLFLAPADRVRVW